MISASEERANMNKKILLLEPMQSNVERWGSFSKESGLNPPLGLFSIYAYMKEKKFDIDLIDTQIIPLTPEQLIEQLKKKNYDIIGIPVFTITAYAAFHTAALCKKALPEVLVVLGNVHATSLPEQTLRECPEADIIVMGEGEYTLEELALKHIQGNRVKDIESIKGIAYRDSGSVRINERRPLIPELDVLPSIFEYVSIDQYVPFPHYYRVLPAVSSMTQRGCPFSCSFCAASVVHGKKTRFKSIAFVVKELRSLKEKYKIRSIYFQDSTMTLDRDYTLALCEEIQKAKLDIEWSCFSRVDCVDTTILKAMKKAGCWQICYGVESGNAASLERVNKGGQITLELIEKIIQETKKEGIHVLASFILGLPGEDEAMAMNTIRFALKLAPQTALFYLPMPFPGTQLYDQCKQSGGIRSDATWLDYMGIDFSNPVYVNPLLGKDKMIQLYHLAWRKFYFSSRIWWVNLRSLRSLAELNRYKRAGKALFSFLIKNIQRRR